MAEEYTFVKDVTKLDWVALPRPFIKGEKVIRFHGHTYGLDRDDAMYLGIETIPCKLPGDSAFFTVPVKLLVDEKGEHPEGDYLTKDRFKQIRDANTSSMTSKSWSKPE